MTSPRKKFKKVVIGTFSGWKNNKRLPVNGMIEPLLSFFGPITRQIILIDCPHPGSDTVSTVIEHYYDNKITKQFKKHFVFPSDNLLKRYNSEIKTQPLFKIRDFLSSLVILMSQSKKTDVFIGLESIHTLAGIIAKKFNKVNKVIYYVSDYSPKRYQSKLFNKIYLLLDRFCATNCDVIWDVSPAMMPARIAAGLRKEKAKKVVLVPNALFPWQINVKKQSQQQPNSLVFAGTIGEINGLDLAIEAFALAKKKNPKLIFHIFGGGVKKDERKVDLLIKKYKLKKSVIQHGFISDLMELTDKVSSCMVGIAPYRSIAGSIRWYADATKIRLYFAAGLPVITTHVPPLAVEAEKAGAAVVVKDKKEQLAQAILDMFSKKDKYTLMRKKAISFAKGNTWDNAYSKAVSQLA